MDRSPENTSLSFERILFFSDAGLAALGKLWFWRYAVSKRETMIAAEVDDELIKQISLRSLAVPIVCVIAIGLSFIAVAFGGFAFPLIPLIANLLYRKKKEAKA